MLRDELQPDPATVLVDLLDEDVDDVAAIHDVLDVSDAAAVAAAHAQLRAMGPIDFVLIAAGTYKAMRADAFDLDVMLAHHKVNYIGALNVLAVLLPDFIADGTEGLLVETDEQLAASTAQLLTHPDELHAMRSYNLRHRPSADWSVVLELHRELYAWASRLVPAAGAASAHVARVAQREPAGLGPDQQAVRARTDGDAVLQVTRLGGEDVHLGVVPTREP